MSEATFGNFEEEVEYTDGHRCIPNGVGDFDMICPTLGNQGFVPIMLRRSVARECACGIFIRAAHSAGEKPPCA
jgi:hypothetical protein